MPYGKRLWRTEDGRLVEDGHPAARLLAYGADDALSEEDAELVDVADSETDPETDAEPEPETEKVDAEATPKPRGRRTAKAETD